MTKTQFIKRLKKMLERYPDKPCGYCPTAKYYQANESPEDCHACQETMGLEYKLVYTHKHGRTSAGCPCYRLTPEEAVTRAWEVIREFEKENS